MANFMPHEHQASRLKFIFENHFSFSIKTYVVGSQEKRLIECEVVKAITYCPFLLSNHHTHERGWLLPCQGRI